MLDIKRILCPTDFSECSTHAFEQAIALATLYDAEIALLNVYTVPLAMAALAGDGSSVPIGRSTLAATYGAEASRDLGIFLESVPAGGVTVRALAREGGAIDTILKEATEWPADLVVMGTHGRSGFERMLLGSVSERVVRKAPCPVLTVPRRVAGTPRPFRRILCPVDFSASSLLALRHALSLAKEIGARLIVVHVLEMLPAWETDEDGVLELSEFRQRLEREARERLRAAVPDAARDQCVISESVVTGQAWKVILQVAVNQGMDLIVMGVRGRGAADLMLFGSTTQHVMRLATCPVLTIREAYPSQLAGAHDADRQQDAEHARGGEPHPAERGEAPHAAGWHSVDDQC